MKKLVIILTIAFGLQLLYTIHLHNEYSNLMFQYSDVVLELNDCSIPKPITLIEIHQNGDSTIVFNGTKY